MGFSGSVEVPGPNIFFVEQPPFQVNVFDGKDYFLTCRLNLGEFSVLYLGFAQQLSGFVFGVFSRK